jgi:hypothetical protein
MGHGLVLACGDCAPAHLPPEGDPFIVIALIVAVVVIGGGMLFWQRRRRHPPPPVTDQWSAMVAMGELCPTGWQAEIKLHGGGEPPSTDPFSSNPSPIVVEWMLYEHGSDRIAIRRRVSVDTLDQAMQAMVDDRRLDVMLGQIEQSAAEGEERI